MECKVRLEDKVSVLSGGCSGFVHRSSAVTLQDEASNRGVDAISIHDGKPGSDGVLCLLNVNKHRGRTLNQH